MTTERSGMSLEQVLMILEAAVAEKVGITPQTTGWLAEAVKSHLSRDAVVSTPPGYVLVPVEPTEAMCDAGGEIEVPSNAYHYSDIVIGYEKAAAVYKAMLAQRDGG